MFKNIAVATSQSQSEWDQGDFEEDVDYPSGVEEIESKAPKSQSKKIQINEGDICKICRKKFPNLFIHLSRWSKDCRSEYGKEFEEVEKNKNEKRRAKELKRKHESYKINKDDIKKRRIERYSQDGGVEKERNRQYDRDHSEERKEYRTRNAAKIKVI